MTFHTIENNIPFYSQSLYFVVVAYIAIRRPVSPILSFQFLFTPFFFLPLRIHFLLLSFLFVRVSFISLSVTLSLFHPEFSLVRPTRASYYYYYHYYFYRNEKFKCIFFWCDFFCSSFFSHFISFHESLMWNWLSSLPLYTIYTNMSTWPNIKCEQIFPNGIFAVFFSCSFEFELWKKKKNLVPPPTN